MAVYRVSGEALLTLVEMAASSPQVNAEAILGIMHGVELEVEPTSQAGDDGSSEGDNQATLAVKPAKPE